MIYIPDEILKITGNESFTENVTGKSDSRVLVFPDYVLKIQKRSFESDNEVKIILWLNRKLPCPKILYYGEENGTAYTLESRIKGEMLCSKKYMNSPEELLQISADALKMLWSVDIQNCSVNNVSLLKNRLIQARYNVENNLVDMDDAEPDTFGPDAFKDPMELLLWLENNQPEEDLALTHGDLCLPNIFAAYGKITGFIDLGKAGPADRWQDIALMLRSIEHNASGFYTDGKQYFDFKQQMLLDRLGIAMNEEKKRYYTLLDELF